MTWAADREEQGVVGTEKVFDEINAGHLPNLETSKQMRAKHTHKFKCSITPEKSEQKKLRKE